MARVLIVDDHPLFRRGLESLLSTIDGIEVVATAADGTEAVALTLEHRPGVVLMDLNLPGTSGLEATRQIAAAAPEVGVLVLTMVDDDDSVLAAVRVGARGYLLKGAPQEEVVAALQTVAAGGAVFGPEVAARVLAGDRTRGRYVGYDLTEREAQVLAGIADGQSNQEVGACPLDRASRLQDLVMAVAKAAMDEIARALGLSLKTVQNHTSRVLTKLQVRDRTQAALRMRGH